MSEPFSEQEFDGVRPNDYAIHPLILHRWSPRSFLDKPVPEEDVMAVLEAARWAPSCFNEQPWRFLVARTPGDRQRAIACLNPKNQSWAGRAPVLLAVISKPTFQLDGSTNPWRAFDSGTAWGYLALEAKHRGLIAHAMGGFSAQKIRAEFRVPEAWGVHAMVALGYRGPANDLPEDLKATERPTSRIPLEKIWAEGQFDFEL